MRKLTLSMMAVFAVFGAGQLQAQTTANPNARVVIPQVLYIDVDAIDFGTVGATELNAGAVSTTADVRHRGNVAHDVTMQADQANLTGASAAAPTIPVTDIAWAAGALSGAMSNAAAATVVDAAAKGTNTTTLSFDLTLDYADDPDTYTAPVTFTIAPN